jgi:hypothetical protein
MRLRHRAGVVVVVAVAATVLGTVAAFGFFVHDGAGTASGTAGTPQAVTLVAATGTPSSDLYPGATADLAVTLDNPNSFAVTLVGVAQNGTVTPVGGTEPGTACSTANTGVTVPTQSSLSVTVAAGSGVTIHIANGASMSTASASGCQGATFRIPLTATVQK